MLTFLATFSSSIFLQCFCSFIMINAIVWKWFWKAHIYWVLNFEQCWRQSALEVDKSCNNTCAVSEHPNVHCSSSFDFVLSFSSLFIVLNHFKDNQFWKWIKVHVYVLLELFLKYVYAKCALQYIIDIIFSFYPWKCIKVATTHVQFLNTQMCTSSFRIFILSFFIVLNYNRPWKCS